MKTRKPTAPGNTITEYLFVAVLILGSFSTALMLFGNSMNKVSGNLKSEFKSRAETASVKRALSEQQSQLSINNPVSKPFRAMKVGADGQIMMVPASPFTAGANGNDIRQGTSHGSSNLDPQQAAKKQEEDENLIQALANSSHEAAELEEHLAVLSSVSNGNVDRLQQTRIMVDGKPVDANELAGRLKETADKVSQQSIQVQQTVSDREAVNEVVEKANEVIDQATEVSETTREVLNRRGHPDSINATVTAEETHKDAGVICRRGRRSDNGRRCNDNED